MGKIDMLQAVGTVILDEIDPPRKDPTSFTAYLTKAPVVVAGYGGWSRGARPRRKALTEWVGRDSISIQCEFLIDTHDENEGTFTEETINFLEYLAAIGKNEPDPPLVLLRSNPEPLMPHGFHRAAHAQWFIESLTWDADSIIVNRYGNRIRAGGTFTVTQYVADEHLTSISQAGKNKAGKGNTGGGTRKTYIVKAGDTLSRIAARKDVYNNAKLWPRIRDANNIRDPKNLKKYVGKKIKIP